MNEEGYPFDLGTYSRPITTSSPLSQKWFDRGLIWSYAFNHEEAAECFQKAIDHDPSCAMAHWGLAYCIGPNYNKPWAFFEADELVRVVRRGHDAAIQGQAHLESITPVEQALVKAVLRRYPDDKPAADCEPWNLAFANAMQTVHQQFPDDLDVITIYVDAVMNLHPWAMWNLQTGEPTRGAQTLEMKAILDHGLALPVSSAAHHPGLLHLYIHLLEMSPHPEAGLAAADNLRTLVPDAGHLLHMPSHLDILTGAYPAAAVANSLATVADERYLAHAGPLNFYTLYRSHDYHFLIYAALFSARSALALDTCARLETSLPDELLRIKSPPMADRLEAFLAVRAHVLVRFGRWDDILALPLPHDRTLYCTTTSTLLYAKGLAHAALSQLPEARDAQSLFLASLALIPPSRTLFNNTVHDLLAVAREMLAGEIAYREGTAARHEAAFTHLREAVRLSDALPYDEPWGWMQPVRHALGALLLEQGRIEDARAVYAADLGIENRNDTGASGGDAPPRALRHPGNVWAMHGYHECLVRLGKVDEAKAMEGKLKELLDAADVEISSSCFCRRGQPKACGDCA
ncbi:hypothetical protein ACHAQA_004962 [Verticillium albo-atrum]